jgi:hypothetical protein
MSYVYTACSVPFTDAIALYTLRRTHPRMSRNGVRAAAHQLRQDKHQDMRQKMQSCFIRDSDSSPHTEVARVCVLSHLQLT